MGWKERVVTRWRRMRAVVRAVWRSMREVRKADPRTAWLAIGCALLLGVAPVAKATIEAALLSEFAKTAGSTGMLSTDVTWDWNEVVPLPSVADAKAVVPVVVALVLYAFLVVAVWGLSIVSSSASSRLTKRYFVTLQLLGWQAALDADADLEASVLEVANDGAIEEWEKRGSVGDPPEPIGSEPAFWSKAVQDGATSVSAATIETFGILQGAITFAFAVYAVWGLGGWVMGSFALVLGIAVALTVVQARRLRGQRKDHEKLRAKLNARTADILEHRDVVRAWEQTEVAKGRLKGYADEYATVDATLEVASTRYSQTTNAVIDVGKVGVAAVFAFVVSGATNSTQDVFFVTALYLRLLSPLMTVVTTLNHWAESRAKTTIFSTLVDGAPTDGDTPQEHAKLPRGDGEDLVVFDDVTFTYPGTEKPTLEGVSLRIPRDKTTLIVGRSGSGKTTIARLMMGFLAPDEPRADAITFDGTATSAVSLPALLERIDYVAQEHHTLHGSVRDNLFASPDASAETLTAILRRLGLGQFELRDEARKLSFGQRQRLAFGRLLLDTGADLAILDEPVAGIDTLTMAEVFEVLQEELLEHKRTVVIISHRLVFAQAVDHVITLIEQPDGPVRIEQGSRDELLAEDSEFARLYKAARAELDGDPTDTSFGRSTATVS